MLLTLAEREMEFAKIQGFVIFIENGKVGHRFNVRVTEVADRFAKATII
jgi:predicted RNA-binding protein with TRAM domain